MKIYQYPSKAAEKRVQDTIERGLGFSKTDYENVETYLEDVKTRGDEALVEYTNKFDSGKVTVDSLKVSRKEFDQALKKVDDSFLKALDCAVNQVTLFHEKQKKNSRMIWLCLSLSINSMTMGMLFTSTVQLEIRGIWLHGDLVKFPDVSLTLSNQPSGIQF